jgi:heme oxygenase
MFNFYHHKLKHSYSIKKVLPVFSTYSHEDLEVKHGGMAMETFKKYPTYDQETFKKKYEALIKYCQLDTFAMVEILDGARKLV